MANEDHEQEIFVKTKIVVNNAICDSVVHSPVYLSWKFNSILSKSG